VTTTKQPIDLKPDHDTLRSSATYDTHIIDQSLLAPIKKAVAAAGVDFSSVVASLPTREVSSEDAQVVKETDKIDLTEYFLLLEKIALLTGDETFNLSKRPLLPGALHFALSQALLLPTFEEAIRAIAKSFNMLHGGNYNHIIYRDDMLIYTVHNDGFPYPFELNTEQSNSLMECILIFMHTMFGLTVNGDHDKHLLKVCTKRNTHATDVIQNQLSYWTVPIKGNNSAFSLVYDVSAASMPVNMDRKLLPAPYAMYGLIADTIQQRSHVKMPIQKFAPKVTELLTKKIRPEPEIAAAMGISKRTLRRHLSTEQASFRSIYNQVLSERACTLLQNGHLIEEVAEELGYSDERSFRRAFLRWKNQSPASYQRQILAEHNPN